MAHSLPDIDLGSQLYIAIPSFAEHREYYLHLLKPINGMLGL